MVEKGFCAYKTRIKTTFKAVGDLGYLRENSNGLWMIYVGNGFILVVLNKTSR